MATQLNGPPANGILYFYERQRLKKCGVTSRTYIEANSAITSAWKAAPILTNKYPYISPAGPPFSNPFRSVL